MIHYVIYSKHNLTISRISHKFLKLRRIVHGITWQQAALSEPLNSYSGCCFRFDCDVCRSNYFDLAYRLCATQRLDDLPGSRSLRFSLCEESAFHLRWRRSVGAFRRGSASDKCHRTADLMRHILDNIRSACRCKGGPLGWRWQTPQAPQLPPQRP